MYIMAKQQLPKTIHDLCRPSQLYFIISFISLLIIAMQNYGNQDKYCIGNFNCDVYSTSIIFIFKIMYILLWTWILNLICNAGYKNISWLLVLFPFVLMFVLIGLMFIVK